MQISQCRSTGAAGAMEFGFGEDGCGICNFHRSMPAASHRHVRSMVGDGMAFCGAWWRHMFFPREHAGSLFERKQSMLAASRHAQSAPIQGAGMLSQHPFKGQACSLSTHSRSRHAQSAPIQGAGMLSQHPFKGQACSISFHESVSPQER